MSRKNGLSKLFLLTISTVLASSELLAASDMPEQTKKPVEPTEFTSQPKTMVTPAIAPTVKNGADFFARSSFIYWNLNLSDLTTQYAQTGRPYVTQTTGSTIPSGSVMQVNSQWEPGFKVGAGLELQHDGWDVYAEWTWLNPINTKAVSTNTTANIADDIFLVPLVNPASTSALMVSDTFKYHYNAIDAELGRNFFYSRYLTVRPFVGVKALSLKQSAKRVNRSDAGTPAWSSSVARERAWGVGPKMGTDAVWHFSRNWGIYGDFAFSAVSSWLTFETITISNNLALDDPTVTSNSKTTVSALIPVFDIGVGFEYMSWLSNEEYMLSLKAGWEAQYDLPWQQSSAQMMGLGLQGLTFEAGFHF